MTIIVRLATLVMLVPAAVWTGVIVLYAVERVNLWSRMPIDQFVVDFRRSVYRADPLQPILAIVSLIGTVIFALSTTGDATVLAWIGAALIASVVAMSIALPERINSQFRKRPEGEAPPNAGELRTRWRTLHFIRTVPAIAAVICLVLAATFA